jgi:hypothetical protein
VYLKCRFRQGSDGKYAIQVYHHHKEADLVHHCKMYDAPGSTEDKECHCFCAPGALGVNADGSFAPSLQ